MTSGKVEILTIENDLLKGSILPYDDFKDLDKHFPVISLYGQKEDHLNGFYVMTNTSLIFIHKSIVKSVSCYRFT
jgi:hypothetical protein